MTTTLATHTHKFHHVSHRTGGVNFEIDDPNHASVFDLEHELIGLVGETAAQEIEARIYSDNPDYRTQVARLTSAVNAAWHNFLTLGGEDTESDSDTEIQTTDGLYRL